MRKILLLVTVFLLVGGSLYAQSRRITGKVTSTEDGSTLPGVNVVVKGTTMGTATDADGNYSIEVSGPDAIISFSFIGLSSQEITVGERTVINVSLALDVTQLSEVVVTGYSTVEKRSVTGSIASVKGETLANLPLQSFDRALQGRAAGVLVQSNTGIPGGSVTVRIRGQGSITAGNDPLYIVDGVQMNTRMDASFTQSNPLAFLNPNDIESIEVLKDAATAAIYGAQASNGVVLITTKKGKKGKTKIDVSYYMGVSQQLKEIDVYNTQEWFQLRKEVYLNSFQGNAAPNETAASYYTLRDMGILPTGFPSTNTFNSAANVNAANAFDINALELGRLSDGTIGSYDWQDAAFRTGKVQNIEVSASGGDDRTTFFASASYNKQEAIVSPVSFERGTVSLKVKNQVASKVSFETNINLSTFVQNVPFGIAGSSLGLPTFSASAILPHNRIYNEDGTYNTAILGVLNQNVIAVSAWNSGEQRTNQLVGNLAVNYEIMKNLSWRTFVGLDYRLTQGENFRDPRTPDGAGVGGRASAQSNWNTNVTTFSTINYSTTIASNHNISAVAGVEFRNEVNKSLTGSSVGFPTYQFRTVNSGATPEAIGGFETGFKRAGVFAKVSYNFSRKYWAEVTGRYDGSSRFGADNLFGFFPSVSAGWTLKEESFLKDVDLLTELKLRASYGETGNDQIGNFDSRGLYGGGFSYAGGSGIRPTQLPNPALKWERNQSINLGLDFGFLNSRITGAVDVYQRKTSDLLLGQTLPWVSGFANTTANVGEVLNRGIEIELNTINLDINGFQWRTNFNIAYNDNEISSLYGGLKELPGDASMRVGESIGTYFVAPYAGVNPANGRPMWFDIDGDYVYTHTAADRRVVGDLQPNVFGGFTNTFSYKGIELSFFFNYEYGRTVSDTQYSFLYENGTRLALNAIQEVADARWTTPGQVTWIPRQVNTGTETRGSGRTSGSAILQKSDYIRLKQVSLSYNFPSSLISRAKLSSARIYVQGINLWTYADYIGYDPEWNFGAVGTNTAGIMPQSKNFTVGLQVGF